MNKNLIQLRKLKAITFLEAWSGCWSNVLFKTPGPWLQPFLFTTRLEQEAKRKCRADVGCDAKSAAAPGLLFCFHVCATLV